MHGSHLGPFLDDLVGRRSFRIFLCVEKRLGQEQRPTVRQRRHTSGGEGEDEDDKEDEDEDEADDEDGDDEDDEDDKDEEQSEKANSQTMSE